MSISALAPRRRRLTIVIVLIGLITAYLVLGRNAADPVQGAQGTPIYGTCTGVKQGVIKGDVTAKGHTGELGITALTEGVAAPFDPSSGQATGAHEHKPIVITLAVGRATPELLSALVDNEELTKCRFNFYKPSAQGTITNYFRIDLTNANVVSHSLSGHQSGTDTNTFSFTYQKITWTYLTDLRTATDDWSSPIS